MTVQCRQRAHVGEWLRVDDGRFHQGLDHRRRAVQGDHASPSRDQELQEAARLRMWHLHLPQGLSLSFPFYLSILSPLYLSFSLCLSVALSFGKRSLKTCLEAGPRYTHGILRLQCRCRVQGPLGWYRVLRGRRLPQQHHGRDELHPYQGGLRRPVCRHVRRVDWVLDRVGQSQWTQLRR